MNWEYISGFFDADGSIYLNQVRKGNKKTIVISFCNTELIILEKIKLFIFNELGIKGFICIKKAVKETHSTCYELKYTNLNKSLLILNKMNIRHSKKHYRKVIAFKLKACTPRNGKYNQKMLNDREKLEELFYKDNVN